VTGGLMRELFPCLFSVASVANIFNCKVGGEDSSFVMTTGVGELNLSKESYLLSFGIS
jgi:hypothetical protein